MKFSTMLIAGAMLTPAAAVAQTTPAPAAGAQGGVAASAAPTAGATIYDTAGGVVGTVDSVNPDGSVVVSTGTIKAAVPATSVGKGAKGLVMAMTKAQLEAAAGQQQAAAGASFKAKLTPGTQVVGTGGTNLGTIKAADAQFVTLTTARGDAKLPISGFGPSPTGGVALGMTAAQLDAAMGQAGAPAAGAATTTSSTTTTTTAPAAGATGDVATGGAATDPAAAGATTDASAGTATTTETTTTKKTTKKKK